LPTWCLIRVVFTYVAAPHQQAGPKSSLLHCVAPPPMLLYQRLPCTSACEGSSAPSSSRTPLSHGSLSIRESRRNLAATTPPPDLSLDAHVPSCSLRDGRSPPAAQGPSRRRRRSARRCHHLRYHPRARSEIWNWTKRIGWRRGRDRGGGGVDSTGALRRCRLGLKFSRGGHVVADPIPVEVGLFPHPLVR
jgi:hypothetical protein